MLHMQRFNKNIESNNIYVEYVQTFLAIISYTTLDNYWSSICTELDSASQLLII